MKKPFLQFSLQKLTVNKYLRSGLNYFDGWLKSKLKVAQGKGLSWYFQGSGCKPLRNAILLLPFLIFFYINLVSKEFHNGKLLFLPGKMCYN